MSYKLPVVDHHYVLEVLDDKFRELEDEIADAELLFWKFKVDLTQIRIDHMKDQQRQLILAKQKLIEAEKHK
jgi:hypothetical protein|tara:strand:- start:891 stop:1106 length:216 start_codon:yes stop_codon:yes gene_type:complete